MQGLERSRPKNGNMRGCKDSNLRCNWIDVIQNVQGFEFSIWEQLRKNWIFLEFESEIITVCYRITEFPENSLIEAIIWKNQQFDVLEFGPNQWKVLQNLRIVDNQVRCIRAFSKESCNPRILKLGLHQLIGIIKLTIRTRSRWAANETESSRNSFLIEKCFSEMEIVRTSLHFFSNFFHFRQTFSHSSRCSMSSLKSSEIYKIVWNRKVTVWRWAKVNHPREYQSVKIFFSCRRPLLPPFLKTEWFFERRCKAGFFSKTLTK